MNSGMIAAVASAAGLKEGEKVEITTAFIAQHFPAIAAELTTNGAKAERERIIGIEAAAMPGHDTIIKAHKADPAKTPADAALAVIAAENAVRGKQVENLKADENQVKNLRSETANDTLPKKAAEPALDGEAAWKAEWATGKPQAEHGFPNEQSFMAHKRAEARGAVKVLKDRKAA